MKFLLLISIFLLCSIAHSQNITYFNEDNDTVTVNDAWSYYIQLRQENPQDTIWIEEKFNNQKQILRQKYFYYNKFKNQVSHGKYKEWDFNGQIRKDIFYQKGSLHDNLKTYWANGQLKRNDMYQMDSLLSGDCYDNVGNKIPHFAYNIAPEYKSGPEELNTFLNKNIRYPEEAMDNGFYGTVYINFVINKDGSLSDLAIKEAPEKSLGDEGLRVVRLTSGNWKPGYIDGDLVIMKMLVPIRFKLDIISTPDKKSKRKS